MALIDSRRVQIKAGNGAEQALHGSGRPSAKKGKTTPMIGEPENHTENEGASAFTAYVFPKKSAAP